MISLKAHKWDTNLSFVQRVRLMCNVTLCQQICGVNVVGKDDILKSEYTQRVSRQGSL